MSWQHVFNAKLVPEWPGIELETYDIDDEYINVKIQQSEQEAQVEEVKQSDEAAALKMRKLQVNEIFSAALQPQDEEWDYESDWTPHKALPGELD